MRFTTLTFLVFFIIVYVLYWSMKGRSRMVLVPIVSFIFYAAWSVGFALHFLFIVIINYFIVVRLHENRSKNLMRFGVILNLANLFLFKYFYLLINFLHDISGAAFFTKSSFNGWLSGATGFGEITLPLAISFYTFQLVAYLVDTHRGNIPEKAGFLEYMFFILYFPHFVAGPIMRHADFIFQLKDIRPDRDRMINGCFLILQGLIKKIVIADNITGAITPMYMHPENYSGGSNLAANIGYSARVYCDFSGYTDIARGLANLMGLDLPENFRAPYMSQSLRELWTRWHITLSSWLRDYIFIPLGGSRVSEFRTHVNFIITFTLAGLWHGANYTYVFWGFMHGVGLSVERLGRTFLEKRRTDRGLSAEAPASPGFAGRLKRGAFMILIYVLFLAGCFPFNSPNISSAWIMAKRVFMMSPGASSPHNGYLIGMLCVTIFFNWMQYKNRIPALSVKVRYAALLFFALITTALVGRFAPGGADFIYFQF